MTPDVQSGLTTLAAGRLMRPGAPVFAGSDGSRLGADAVPYRFAKTKAAVKEIPAGKLARLRWHELRHTYASLVVTAGVSIYDVSKAMGHSAVTVTKPYAHFAPDAGQAAQGAARAFSA